MKRIWLLLCLMFILTGCQETENAIQDGQTTIVFLNSWGSGDDRHQVMRQIYQDFEKENPDIKLSMIAMPSSEKVADKVREMVSVGKVPNLIYSGGGGMDTLYPFMAEHEYLLDLMPYIKEDKQFADCISPENYAAFQTQDGKLYTVTDILHVCGYWYNVNMFENAGITQTPETWEEFLLACEKISSWTESIQYDIVPLHLDTETAALLTEAYVSGREQEPAAGTDTFQEAIDLLELIGRYAAPEPEPFTYQDNIRSLNIGRCAIYAGDIAGEQLLNREIRIAYSAFPLQSGEKMNLASATPGFLVGNTGNEEQQEACIRFLKYMLSEPVQERILREAGYLPSNPGIDKEELQETNPRLYDAWKMVEDYEILGKMTENDGEREELKKLLEKSE
ncbi:MAG: ABC transporter substrate-binding protein [Fusicatenibacter sp.]|nr:ABC transporter substrate-binding protein [Fusicatenibacter sp.]